MMLRVFSSHLLSCQQKFKLLGRLFRSYQMLPTSQILQHQFMVNQLLTLRRVLGNREHSRLKRLFNWFAVCLIIICKKHMGEIFSSSIIICTEVVYRQQRQLEKFELPGPFCYTCSTVKLHSKNFRTSRKSLNACSFCFRAWKHITKFWFKNF